MTYTLEELKKMMDDNGGSLDLEGCTGLTSLPDGLAVGGSLDLEGCTGLTSLPDGLAVSGNLYLRGCTGLTSLPEGLTVSGSLYLCGCNGIVDKDAERKKVRRLVDGEYVKGRYLYADGILTHVKRKKKIGNYDYFVGKIKNKNVVFDGTNYAHCKDFQSGVCDTYRDGAPGYGAEPASAAIAAPSHGYRR